MPIHVFVIISQGSTFHEMTLITFKFLILTKCCLSIMPEAPGSTLSTEKVFLNLELLLTSILPQHHCSYPSDANLLHVENSLVSVRFMLFLCQVIFINICVFYLLLKLLLLITQARQTI